VAGLALAVPARLAPIGRAVWPNRSRTLLYFACLGAGFLILELTLLQVGLRVIGVPIQAYAATIGTLLVSAGLGSLTVPWIARGPRRIGAAFIVLLVVGALVAWLHAPLGRALEAAPLPARIAGLMAGLAPLGYLLGLPFPLGIRALRDAPSGAIAWAWSANAIATVLGGVASATLAISLGLRATLVIGLAFYAIAALAAIAALPTMTSTPRDEPVKSPPRR
jgi:hypothetical protein